MDSHKIDMNAKRYQQNSTPGNGHITSTEACSDSTDCVK